MEMIMYMDDSYLILKNKLNDICSKKEIQLDDKMKKMMDYLIGDEISNTSNIIADRIVSQYEEEKGNITFGVVVENAERYYLTYILIFVVLKQVFLQHMSLQQHLILFLILLILH